MPCTAMVALCISIPSFSQIYKVLSITPLPVASARPKLPPSCNGLPVTTAGVEWPFNMLYVSIIQPITSAFVPTSGAGISRSGPMIGEIIEVKRRVSRCNSDKESVFGSTAMPPLPPPYGISATAHLKVIHAANALTSSSFTSW